MERDVLSADELTSKPLVSINRLLYVLRKLPLSDDEVSLYRGHGMASFTLKPSVARNSTRYAHDNRFLREFISSFPSDFLSDETTLERLVRAQQYHVPTRLLDLSWNPLVALYFACENNFEDDGQVIIFTTRNEDVKYYDSDSVTIQANLANLSIKSKLELRAVFEKDKRPTKSNLNKMTAIKLLVRSIRNEKPDFDTAIEPNDLVRPFFVKPKISNRRILAQNGAFAISGVKVMPDNSEGFRTTRLTVPAKNKTMILRELRRIGIHRSSLFPEIENAAGYIRDRLGLPADT